MPRERQRQGWHDAVTVLEGTDMRTAFLRENSIVVQEAVPEPELELELQPGR